MDIAYTTAVKNSAVPTSLLTSVRYALSKLLGTIKIEKVDLLRSELEKLECHFTWSLESTSSKLQAVKELLESCSQINECQWQGQLYNFMGYILHSQGSSEEALTYLKKAEKTISDLCRPGELGPKLLVNQANLAWVHYHLGELQESQAYLRKVEKITEECSVLSKCTLHPEVNGEKGWTFVKFDLRLKREAIKCFTEALKGDPMRREWNRGLATAMVKAYPRPQVTPAIEAQILAQVKRARELDPDDQYLTALYLNSLSVAGQVTDETKLEGERLAKRLTKNLDGLREALAFFRSSMSLDFAIEVAENVLESFPSEIYVKKQLAICYKWKVFMLKESNAEDQDWIQRATALHEEVISLRPHYLRGKLALADIHARSGNIERADEMYEELLYRADDLELEDRQLLYSHFSTHLYWIKAARSKSIDYHMKVAEIPHSSRVRKNSIRILRDIIRKGMNERHGEIVDFLYGLDDI
ncbi:interferon-induced protein with tetratricopeptide repeats 1-like [Chanos chanos]|uniref:Interferon-induced protein with tetratricopeptide repeats 1-like n=1 Tax=Chanos chanos TaxID=29144 RepID=A0A6J2VTH8_CHACN|nr:interferon-induced protein with tetratricopeptide repeats 1-like [Chanos chanos]